MAVLKIERVPIKYANLGWFGMDHLHLTLDTDVLGGEQDNWWVLEGVRDGGDEILRLGTLGGNGVTTLSQANEDKTGEALVAEIGLPAWRGARIIPLNGNELSSWVEMASLASDIDDQALPYVAYANPLSAVSTINSSSVVASLLFFIGIDITQYFPTTLRFSPGWETLLGTSSDDSIVLQASFRNAYGGAGEDTLEGQDGNLLPERLYGGRDDDRFLSSSGVNYYHGGEYGLEYREDGTDTVVYRDVAVVSITLVRGPSQHQVPEYEVFHSGGYDQLYSIERLEWDPGNTEIIVGPGLSLIGDTLRIDMGDQSSNDQGDHVNFADAGEALIINVDAEGATVVQAVDAENPAVGLWLDNVEWLTAGAGNDRIYAGAGVRGVDAGEGNDLIDVRLTEAFSGASPSGFDIEASGGEGDDIIVAGSGRTYALGGPGSDRFILSDMTDAGGQMIELVIQDAAPDDRVYIPIDMFSVPGGDFEGSQLFPLLGAFGQIEGQHGFEDLPQNLGPWSGGPATRTDFFRFEWQLQNDRDYGSDQTDGVIDFAGAIFYNRDGADLLIHVFTGGGFTFTDIGSNDEPWERTVNAFFPQTETIVRVVDFQEGDLGIIFHDRGTPTTEQIETDHGPYTVFNYPNWDAAVMAMTNGGQLQAPLEARPEAPSYAPDEVDPQEQPPVIPGTTGDDIIVASGTKARIEAGAGNDSVTGTAGDDVIDGGTGDDILAGGTGNDAYVVDSALDTIVELAGQGRDRVLASVDFTLGSGVEDLRLEGGAVAGFGNEASNTITGTSGANLLRGLGGDDLLIGGSGNDTLEGGLGSDTYVYSPGDGDDVVRDTGDAGDVDALVLDGYLPDDISLFRLAATPGDLIIALADGGRIRIEAFGGPDAGGIDSIRFAGGQSWSAAELALEAAAAPVLASDQPVAVEDFNFMAGSGVVTIPAADLLANDRDPSGGALRIVAVGNVSPGATVTLLGNGDLQLTTAEGSDGAVTFTYTVADVLGNTSSASVEVGIIPNHAPVAAGPITPLTAGEGEAVSYTLPADFFTDADLDPVGITVALAGGAALPNWLAYDGATRTLGGTPPAGSAGRLDVVFTASDGLAATSAVLSLEITGAGNAPPAAGADTGTTQQDVPLVIAASLLLANDSDADLDALAIETVQDGVNGTVMLDAAGNVVFTPATGYVGPASFTYTITDGRGGRATATVALEVSASTPGATIVGTALGETLVGTAGADTIEGREGDDILIGGAGNDVFLVAGNDGNDVFDGGHGADTVRGSAGNDAVGLAAGSSLVSIEEIDGGQGFDIIRLSSQSDVLDLSAVNVISIEEIRAGGGNDTVTGSAGADTINGGGGNDVLRGGGGNDVFLVAVNSAFDDFDGGGGDDLILGGSGDDLIGLAHGTLSLVAVEAIDGSDGYDVLRLTNGNDALDLTGIAVTGIEEILGSAGNDTIVGSAGRDRINGGTGNDVLAGGGGDDDFLVAGVSGFDDFDGGEGFDVVVASGGNDIMGLARGSASLAGIEAIDAGNGFDVLRLSSGNDFLDLSGIVVIGLEEIRGGSGNDTIIGSAGDDRLNGGGGDDVLIGGAGNDTFLSAGLSRLDRIDGGEGYDRILGTAGDDIFLFSGIAGDLAGIEEIDGAGGQNEIRMTAGSDVLDLSGITLSGIAAIRMGGGNDRVVASTSSDTLWGGGGADTFVFRLGSGHDVIGDFQRGNASVPLFDVIDVSDFGLSGFEDLMAHATQDGADTLITIDPATSIRLVNISASSLLADDFRLI